jgi:SAM-dependent methyltransferase
MHASVLDWLAGRRSEFGDLSAWDVLEVGSFNENGSPRHLFPDVHTYLGIDSRPGRGVDEVAFAHALPLPDRSVDLVICTEMLEHDPSPWLSVVEMARVLVPGGQLLLTARGFDAYTGYPEHPCPNDYWRFNEASFNVLLRYVAKLHIIEIVPDVGPEAPGVFGHACKP